MAMRQAQPHVLGNMHLLQVQVGQCILRFCMVGQRCLQPTAALIALLRILRFCIIGWLAELSEDIYISTSLRHSIALLPTSFFLDTRLTLLNTLLIIFQSSDLPCLSNNNNASYNKISRS